MMLDIGYEQAMMAFRGPVWRTGASNGQIKMACRRLRYATRWKSKIDIEADTGMLLVAFPGWTHNHIVLLDEGRIYDTDDMVWDAEQYIHTKSAKLLQLLVVTKKL